MNTSRLQIKRKPLADFVGLEATIASGPGTKKALMDFSYNLACGNTDEAYNAI